MSGLGAQHTSNAAEMPVAELPNRIIRVVAGDFSVRQLLFHRKTRWQAMVKNVISQHAQASGDGLRIPADNFFRMATLDQLCLFRLMQTDRNMFLQIQRLEIRSIRL